MKKFKRLKEYFDICDKEVLLNYSISKHLYEHGEDDDDDSYKNHLVKSYRFTINLINRIKLKKQDNFIIHVEEEEVVDTNSREKSIKIFGVHKFNKNYVDIELEQLPWQDWLGSSIFWDDTLTKLINEYGIEFLVSECLYEITFCGFTHSDEEVLCLQSNIRNNTVGDIITRRLK